MRRTLRAAALSCLLITSFGVASSGQTGSTDWTVDRFHWTGPLAPAARVEVLNSWGDVRVRAADAGEVEVSAMIQRLASEPAAAEVKLGRRGDRLTIEVVYPAESRSDLRRVDLAVFVPAGAALAVRTRDGMIQARGLAGDVDFESWGGDVILSLAGLGHGKKRRASRLTTRAGDVTLRLPAEADARLKIRASGRIDVRRPAEVKRTTARKAVVTLGQGTHRLSIETQQGGVTLLAP